MQAFYSEVVYDSVPQETVSSRRDISQLLFRRHLAGDVEVSDDHAASRVGERNAPEQPPASAEHGLDGVYKVEVRQVA